MTLLEIKDLHVTYRARGTDLPAVRGVSLTVAAGQTVGIAGESGCGKSTLATSVLRLLPASTRISGEILLGGEDVQGMTFGRLRAVRWQGASIVFQGAMHAMNPVRTVGQQIAEPIMLHTPAVRRDEALRRASELLEQVGVPGARRSAYPHELSGGQRQRVMIAMALACGPDLIIADEPTTALDVMVQAQVMALLAELVRERGVGLLLISHDLSVLAASCDTVAVMYAGRIVETGPGHRLFADAAHPYAKALAGAFPVIGDPASRLAPRGLPGDPPDPRELPGGCPFHPRCAVALPECATEDIALRAVGPDRRAACVHVPLILGGGA
ncbi:peptide/nickel transport system ATP-binding protein [Allocatelliglobosispora scoriae]|uniref:Peptide/nickel transport system ATP-binding protein n=1 Tax=Allocatelliglobosispora scoriae TaxID=643052 RepID=A0A841BSM1_9ACTN|nr:ABC transporter ATP-binding protein [Allocatelliglobosispora scoriae]MBB5870179.1 peptide/nickel transport system ATP-binding protein [Allocatelliglobosispora scoriae]